MIVPDKAGGWIHDYICPEHWEALSYVDGAHHCPQGHEMEGEKYDAAWRMYEHRRLADYAADSAAKGETTAVPILLDYAAKYAHYQHQAEPWMLTGHVMAQALTEALWGQPIASAAKLLRPHMTPDEWQTVERDLLCPLLETLQSAQNILVNERQKPHSNYNAWLIAAITSIADGREDGELLEVCAEHVREHLNIAILPDGMQWEGSPYYHNFVALALTLAAETLFNRGIDVYSYTAPNGISFRSLWDALIPLADSQGRIIARRDGAHWRNGPFERELRATYEIAYARTGDSSYGWLLSQLNRRELKDTAEPEQKSVNYPDTGLAVLRKNGQMVTLEYGEHGGEHGHYDKLSLHIPGWTDDPGTPQYGIEERRTWYQQTAAHNTIVVDNMSQAACAGKLVKSDGMSAVAVCDTAYHAVHMKREVSLQDDGSLLDRFTIESESTHVYDWILHGAGKIFAQNIDFSPCKRPLSDKGASRFIEIEGRGELEVGKSAELMFTGENESFLVRLSSDKPAEVFTGYGPGVSESPMVKRPVLVLRINSKEAEITAVYTRKQNE